MIARMLAAAVLATPIAAQAAVTFPADAAYHPLHCHNRRMYDTAGDQPVGATFDRDVVGDGLAPAGLRAADATNLYLRIRVNQTPNNGADLHPYAWGFAFDLDNDPRNYELLIVAEGVSAAAGTVSIYTNHTITVTNSPSDPADLPAAAKFNFVDNGRVTVTSAVFSNNADDFIDVAIPWTTLQPLGLDRATPVHVWAGTSSVANALDGDLACFDGNASITLDGAAPSQTTGDPTMDPSGDGGDDGTGPDPGDPGDGGGGGDDAGSLRLEGGSGCATATGGAGALGGGLVIALAALGSRRRRRFG